MIVSVIGYKNHSQRIINILVNIEYVKKILIFHPTKDINLSILGLTNPKLFFTNNWDDLRISRCYFICAPNNYHYFYLNKIISHDPKSYIYCEKPPVVKKSELNWLEINKSILYKRTLFGFNFRFTKFYKYVSETFEKNKLGFPIHINFNLSYGIAFKKNMRNNWRFNDPSVFSRITGNLGIHYLNFSQSIFGDIIDKKIFESNNVKHNQNDTSLIVFKTEKNILVSIFISYASVSNEEVNFYFSNGIISKHGNKVFLYSPRDVFNEKGNFIKPNGQLIFDNVEEDNGLSNSINFFIKTILNKKHFDQKLFEDAVKANKFFIS